MHFEAFISSQKQDVQQHLEFMQKLYIALDEPDGVAGVAASRKQQPTLHEQILDHKSSGESEKLECSGNDLIGCREGKACSALEEIAKPNSSRGT